MADNALAIVHSDAPALSIDDVKNQVQIIQRVMRDVMHQDEHFGIIPGTRKNTLYKSGAEKLAFTFRLTRSVETQMTDLGRGHREYQAIVRLTHAPSGLFAGEGVGLCSTMESKYRYRGNAFEVLDEPIPADYKAKKAKYKADGYGARQVDGEWRWVRLTGEKAENPDIADTYNTVLKMAVKRAFIDAILAATAASDIFTQDLEEPLEPDRDAEPEEPADPALQARLEEIRGELSSARNEGLLNEEQAAASLAILSRAPSVAKLNAKWSEMEKRLDDKRAQKRAAAAPVESDDEIADDPAAQAFEQEDIF